MNLNILASLRGSSRSTSSAGLNLILNTTAAVALVQEPPSLSGISGL